ncbi:MAG: methyltransferase domain-containing protein [Planctomycetes bacterium]|nr:methyltransferase domain-containing protein [Planctomycetota bacterium]
MSGPAQERTRHLRAVTIVSLLVGALIAALWVRGTDGSAALAALTRASATAVVLLLTLTAYFVLARFVRWQFLLRRADASVPARDSLKIYLASLPGTATPAYIGEVIRCVLLRRCIGAPLARTLLCLALERTLDVAALSLLGMLTAPQMWMRGVLALTLLCALLVAWFARSIAARRGAPNEVLRELYSAPAVGSAALLSLAIWIPVATGLAFAAWGMGVELAPLAAVGSYSAGTVFSALTLMPAGVGTAGSAQIVLLQEYGLELADAVACVTLFRVLTTGVSLTVGVVFFAVELRAQRRVGAPARGHFDEIAQQYGAQFRPHMWELLLARRTQRLAKVLPRSEGSIGLDLGCGLGLQAQELRHLGWRVIGLEPAHELLRAGGGPPNSSLVANGLALPLRSHSVDFVYTIGVLHHMIGPEEQDRACAEIVRVLKPGGVLVVQETNTLNPLFRVYMGYVFPILSRIDEGTERWLAPRRWRETPGLRLEAIEHFTFVPDFLPRAVLSPLLALERRLETSPLAHLSVHYQATLRKPDTES